MIPIRHLPSLFVAVFLPVSIQAAEIPCPLDYVSQPLLISHTTVVPHTENFDANPVGDPNSWKKWERTFTTFGKRVLCQRSPNELALSIFSGKWWYNIKAKGVFSLLRPLDGGPDRWVRTETLPETKDSDTEAGILIRLQRFGRGQVQATHYFEMSILAHDGATTDAQLFLETGMLGSTQFEQDYGFYDETWVTSDIDDKAGKISLAITDRGREVLRVLEKYPGLVRNY